MSDNTQAGKTFRKGQKVWFLWMDNTGTYQVNQGKVSNQKPTPILDDGKVLVRHQFEYDGEMKTTVSDMRIGEVFATEKEALMWTAAKCRQVANKWLARADELSARIAKAK